MTLELRIVCAWIVLSLAALPAAAGDPIGSPAGAVYILGPEDQITLAVPDVEELDGKAARIDGSGYIDLPLAGHLKAAGLSTSQLSTAISRKLKRYVQAPLVSVSVADYRSKPVSVLGAVNTPGVIYLHGPATLAEVLSRSGGLRTDAGDVIRITRRKQWGGIPLSDAVPDAGGEYITASVGARSLLDARDPQENIPVQPYDTISVPRAEFVYVMGAVRRPGGFVLNERKALTVLQALSMAEGFERAASPKSAKVIHRSGEPDRSEIDVDLTKVLAGKKPDMLLTANDILFVPTSAAKSATLRAIEAAIQAGTGVVIFRR